ncbi:hypothetical protein ACFL6U_30710, partial [Planctomycetota bacterium]
MKASVPMSALMLTVMILGASVGVDAQTSRAEDARPFTVKLQIDKPYCVLNFLETLKTRGYYGPTLYAHYSQSKFNGDKKLAQLVQQYASVKTVYRYECDGIPKYRFAAKDKSTSDMFFTLSAQAKSLEELKHMTVGIIPLDDHLRLFRILEEVEPIYDELVWNPFHKQAQTRLKALQAYADHVNLGGMLGPIARFLNSSWTAEIPLIVSFAIVPGQKIRQVPPPLGNVIRAGLLTESDDYGWYIALIAHEFTHRAFAEQPLKMHQQIDQWLSESKSPYRGTVNLMFDEILAGGVGHKLREDLSGQARAFSYSQAAVKAMDKAAYPLIVSYLEQGRPVDRSFVKECLALYEETFPNALHEYHSLFQVYYLLTDLEGSAARNLPRQMRKNLVGPMMYEVGSGMTEENIAALQAYEFTKFIVITRDHAKTLDLLKRKLTALRVYNDLDAGSDWILSCHDGDRNPYVIVNLQSVENFEQVTN